MSDRKEPGMAFDMKILNKVFAFVSVIFLITVFWVFLDDYIRPWKKVQIEGLAIKREKLNKKIEELEKGLDKNQIANIEKQLDEGKKVVEGRKQQISEVQKSIDETKKLITKQTIINGEYNSNVAATTFEYETAHAHHEKRAEKLFTHLQEYKALFAESRDRLKQLQGELSSKTKELESLKKEVQEKEDELKKLVGPIELLKAAKQKTELGPIFALRNAPMLDFLDPTIKIHQIVLKNITDDRYFQQVPKVDRCTTCHLFIDQEGYEDQQNPYKTHPKLNLMIGANSPHPMKQIGCTVCHGGEGHRVNDFNSLAHTPRNEKQEADWVAKYHWHEGHKIPQPMLPLQYTEGACLKCHKDVEYVPQGTVVNNGIKLIQKFGCYGCHKIEGWEQKRLPGPSLLKIAGKVDKEFFKNWVWDPKAFNKHARMPSFFNQDNNRSTDFQKKNMAEVNAIAEFIYEKSKPFKPIANYHSGNAEKGKQLIKEVGCLACHGVEGLEEESKKVDAGAAPYLSGTGSKVSADWLVSWLKKPSHYQEDTIMPSFRLSDSEANDIAAYLLSLKNDNFMKMKFAPLDKEARDQLLISYFSAFDTLAVAKDKLAKMSDHDKTMELGQRSVGKYGCYSCHKIEGFEGRPPIGPELSKVGSKPIEQIGFGHENVPHKRDAWIVAHLQNPRRWDNGVDKRFEDLLRMPNFNMTKHEAETIATVLLGMVSDQIPLQGMKQLNEYEKTVAKGMKVVNKFNCIGCHQIDGAHGDILNIFQDDINEGPPRLVGEGHRIQSQWLHYFLDNVHPIRPWLKVRMPSFNLSNADKNAIVAMFQSGSKQDTFESLEPIVWAPGEKEAAKKLWDNLACTSCHSAGFNNNQPLAPDLHMAKKRLRPSWIKLWITDPQKIMPGTTMPTFWADGVSPEPTLLGGDSEKQIEAVVKFVREFGENEYRKGLPHN